jgi:aspartyl-tRNA(Asn)/glutamyl-tRNA(Gln) amidotransferase subunit C
MIDKKTIEHIAKLARLQISDAEAQEYSVQLGKALQHFEQISKVDTQGIEPLITPVEIEAFWRDDEALQNYTADEMTANAPARAGNLFKVPPVV